MKKSKYSAIVIGSGISGLFAALELSKFSNLHDGILLISKSKLDDCNSRHAQGGMVAVLKQNKSDSIESHVKDTLVSGRGLSELSVVQNISQNSQKAVEKLLNYGVEFDKDENEISAINPKTKTYYIKIADSKDKDFEATAKDLKVKSKIKTEI